MRLFCLFVVVLLLTGCGAMKVGGATDNSYKASNDTRTSVEIRQDSRITSSITERYVKDRNIDAFDIKVNAIRGVVTLRGHVHTTYAATRAYDIAISVSGVRKVISQIEVSNH